MKKNYAQRLEKLKKRRLDESLQRSILTNSFSDVSINDSAKYALESMSDIDPKYTQNTYLASENICNNLTPALQRRGLSVEYRHQGSITTNTHIKIHSDIDVLVFTDKYVNMEPPLTPANPYQGDPLADLKQLRQECFNILNGIYDQVDDSNSKSIQVFPTAPKRKVDVVPCNWINTMEYQNTYNEKYRGVHVYDKENNSRHKDFPFLNIAQIKEKDSFVNEGLRKLVRLLKTLKVDADYEIKLSSFEISSLVYGIDSFALTVPSYQQLLLLNVGSQQLNKLINDQNYRENLKSPNGKEIVFGNNSSKVVELKKLKLELDELVADITEELAIKRKNINESIVYR